MKNMLHDEYFAVMLIESSCQTLRRFKDIKKAVLVYTVERIAQM